MVNDTSHAEGTNFNLGNVAKFSGMKNCPAAAVFGINTDVFAGNRLHRIQFSPDKMVFFLASAVDVAETVVVVCAQAENQAVAVKEFFVKGVGFKKIPESIIKAFYVKC